MCDLCSWVPSVLLGPLPHPLLAGILSCSPTCHTNILARLNKLVWHRCLTACQRKKIK